MFTFDLILFVPRTYFTFVTRLPLFFVVPTLRLRSTTTCLFSSHVTFLRTFYVVTIRSVVPFTTTSLPRLRLDSVWWLIWICHLHFLTTPPPHVVPLHTATFISSPFRYVHITHIRLFTRSPSFIFGLVYARSSFHRRFCTTHAFSHVWLPVVGLRLPFHGYLVPLSLSRLIPPHRSTPPAHTFLCTFLSLRWVYVTCHTALPHLRCSHHTLPGSFPLSAHTPHLFFTVVTSYHAHTLSSFCTLMHTAPHACLHCALPLVGFYVQFVHVLPRLRTHATRSTPPHTSLTTFCRTPATHISAFFCFAHVYVVRYVTITAHTTFRSVYVTFTFVVVRRFGLFLFHTHTHFHFSLPATTHSTFRLHTLRFYVPLAFTCCAPALHTRTVFTSLHTHTPPHHCAILVGLHTLVAVYRWICTHTHASFYVYHYTHTHICICWLRWFVCSFVDFTYFLFAFVGFFTVAATAFVSRYCLRLFSSFTPRFAVYRLHPHFLYLQFLATHTPLFTRTRFTFILVLLQHLHVAACLTPLLSPRLVYIFTHLFCTFYTAFCFLLQLIRCYISFAFCAVLLYTVVTLTLLIRSLSHLSTTLVPGCCWLVALSHTHTARWIRLVPYIHFCVDLFPSHVTLHLCTRVSTFTYVYHHHGWFYHTCSFVCTFLYVCTPFSALLLTLFGLHFSRTLPRSTFAVYVCLVPSFAFCSLYTPARTSAAFLLFHFSFCLHSFYVCVFFCTAFSVHTLVCFGLSLLLPHRTACGLIFLHSFSACTCCGSFVFTFATLHAHTHRLHTCTTVCFAYSLLPPATHGSLPAHLTRSLHCLFLRFVRFTHLDGSSAFLAYLSLGPLRFYLTVFHSPVTAVHQFSHYLTLSCVCVSHFRFILFGSTHHFPVAVLPSSLVSAHTVPVRSGFLLTICRFTCTRTHTNFCCVCRTHLLHHRHLLPLTRTFHRSHAPLSASSLLQFAPAYHRRCGSLHCCCTHVVPLPGFTRTALPYIFSLLLHSPVCLRAFCVGYVLLLHALDLLLCVGSSISSFLSLFLVTFTAHTVCFCIHTSLSLCVFISHLSGSLTRHSAFASFCTSCTHVFATQVFSCHLFWLGSPSRSTHLLSLRVRYHGSVHTACAFPAFFSFGSSFVYLFALFACAARFLVAHICTLRFFIRRYPLLLSAYLVPVRCALCASLRIYRLMVGLLLASRL